MFRGAITYFSRCKEYHLLLLLGKVLRDLTKLSSLWCSGKAKKKTPSGVLSTAARWKVRAVTCLESKQTATATCFFLSDTSSSMQTKERKNREL